MKALCSSARGFTLLEVLITIVVLAIGLLGLTNLQTKLHMSHMESYQRAQAVVLLQDLANRMQVNRGNAADYITDADRDGVDCSGGSCDWLGTGNTVEACAPPGGSRAAQDRCEWQDQLQGAAELAPDGPDADTDPDAVGGMIGARGCVEQLVAPDDSTGVCQAGVYRITVVWQGLFETAAPDLTCATGQFGTDSLRRAISTTVTIGLYECE